MGLVFLYPSWKFLYDFLTNITCVLYFTHVCCVAKGLFTNYNANAVRTRHFLWKTHITIALFFHKKVSNLTKFRFFQHFTGFLCFRTLKKRFTKVFSHWCCIFSTFNVWQKKSCQVGIEPTLKKINDFDMMQTICKVFYRGFLKPWNIYLRIYKNFEEKQNPRLSSRAVFVRTRVQNITLFRVLIPKKTQKNFILLKNVIHTFLCYVACISMLLVISNAFICCFRTWFWDISMIFQHYVCWSASWAPIVF